MAPKQKGGCLDTLHTPWIRHCKWSNKFDIRPHRRSGSFNRIRQVASMCCPFLIMVSCAHTSLPPSNDISIGSAAFAVLAVLPADRHADIRTTERATPVTIGRTYAWSAASRPNNRH